MYTNVQNAGPLSKHLTTHSFLPSIVVCHSLQYCNGVKILHSQPTAGKNGPFNCFLIEFFSIKTLCSRNSVLGKRTHTNILKHYIPSQCIHSHCKIVMSESSVENLKFLLSFFSLLDLNFLFWYFFYKFHKVFGLMLGTSVVGVEFSVKRIVMTINFNIFLVEHQH